MMKLIHNKNSRNKKTYVRSINRNVSSELLRPTPPAQLHLLPYSPKEAVFKHSGDIGDLIYSLPIIRYLGGGTVLLNAKGLGAKKVDGTMSGFNHEIIKMILPLIEIQPYIHRAGVWENEWLTVDIDIFRKIRISSSNLCEKILKSFACPFSETNNPWLHCDKKFVAHTVFARSARYHNPQMDYKNLINKDSVFVGLPSEHKAFCRSYGHIAYYPVKNFLEMAEVINGSELFVGNQSCPMAMAIGLGKSFMQEVCPYVPDCQFPRNNGIYFETKVN